MEEKDTAGNIRHLPPPGSCSSPKQSMEVLSATFSRKKTCQRADRSGGLGVKCVILTAHRPLSCYPCNPFEK